VGKLLDVDAFKKRRLVAIDKELQELYNGFFELSKLQANNAQRQRALHAERDRLMGKTAKR